MRRRLASCDLFVTCVDTPSGLTSEDNELACAREWAVEHMVERSS